MAMSDNVEKDRVEAIVRRALESTEQDELQKVVSWLGQNHSINVRAALRSSFSEALYDKNPSVRIKAVWLLGKAEASWALSLLYSALNDPSPDVSKITVKAIGKIGHPDAVDPLGNTLLYYQRDPSVREAAAEVLGSLRDGRAVSYLGKACLQDSDMSVRKAAIKALGQIEHPDAILALLVFLVGKNAYLRKGAALVLENIKDRDIKRFTSTLEQIEDATKISKLCNALGTDGDKDVRRVAACVLGYIKDDTAIPALHNALTDKDSYVRGEAVVALGRIGKPEAIPYLINVFTTDADASVQKKVDEAFRMIKDIRIGLGKIKDTTTMSSLCGILHHNSDKDVKYISAKILGYVRKPQAEQCLIDALSPSVHSEDVRKAAIEGLKYNASDLAIDALSKVLKDINTERGVRREAWTALEYINTPKAKAILSQQTPFDKVLHFFGIV